MVWVYESGAKQNGMPNYFIEVKSHLPMINKALVTYNEPGREKIGNKWQKLPNSRTLAGEIKFEHEKQEKDAKGFQLPSHGDSGSGHWVVQKDGKAVLVGIYVKKSPTGKNPRVKFPFMMKTTDRNIMRIIKEFMKL